MLRASGIARRRTEEERTEALFPPRVTTTAADSNARCASSTRTVLRAAKSRRWIPLLILACLIAGCSYDRVEPGLFGRSMRQETTGPPIRPVIPHESTQTPNKDLPVLGEAIWTSADGLDITMRIAIHAVRRASGGTVLDWSVTPLHGPGLRPNDPVPSRIDLGFTRPGEGYPNIVLIDAARSQVYRPLTFKGSGRCLCTSLTLVQRMLRIDHTSVLQIAFPDLPEGLATVDVQLATVPPFWNVPVTPRGMLPLATSPTDLTRPTDGKYVIASTKVFRYGATGQRLLIMINGVYASTTFTSIAWTILAVEPGPGLKIASTPPLADARPPPRPYNLVSASGPQIRLASGRPLARARLVTTKLAGRGALECLCTDLRVGASALTRMGQHMSLVTTLPPIPAGTSKVDIIFPGLATLADIAVTPAPNSALRAAGPAVREVRFWTYRADLPHPGWEPRNWPTPVPRSYQLRYVRATVDAIVR